MVGVVFLSSPGLIISSVREDEELRAEQYPNFSLGVIVALSGSIASGFAYLTMRKLGTNISSVVTTFYFGALSAPACLLMALIF